MTGDEEERVGGGARVWEDGVGGGRVGDSSTFAPIFQGKEGVQQRSMTSLCKNENVRGRQ